MSDKTYHIRGIELDGTVWKAYWFNDRSEATETLNYFVTRPDLIPATYTLELIDDSDTIYDTVHINQESTSD